MIDILFPAMSYICHDSLIVVSLMSRVKYLMYRQDFN